MNTALITANVLVFLTYIVHTFGGDKAYKKIEPNIDNLVGQVHWTMGRGAFHMLSVDFLLASIGLALINFTNFFTDKKSLLQILVIYFIGYGLAFLITLIISRKFQKKFIKLWQWLLMFVIAGLIYYGI